MTISTFLAIVTVETVAFNIVCWVAYGSSLRRGRNANGKKLNLPSILACSVVSFALVIFDYISISNRAFIGNSESLLDTAIITTICFLSVSIVIIVYTLRQIHR